MAQSPPASPEAASALVTSVTGLTAAHKVVLQRLFDQGSSLRNHGGIQELLQTLQSQEPVRDWLALKKQVQNFWSNRQQRISGSQVQRASRPEPVQDSPPLSTEGSRPPTPLAPEGSADVGRPSGEQRLGHSIEECDAAGSKQYKQQYQQKEAFFKGFHQFMDKHPQIPFAAVSILGSGGHYWAETRGFMGRSDKMFDMYNKEGPLAVIRSCRKLIRSGQQLPIECSVPKRHKRTGNYQGSKQGFLYFSGYYLPALQRHLKQHKPQQSSSQNAASLCGLVWRQLSKEEKRSWADRVGYVSGGRPSQDDYDDEGNLSASVPKPANSAAEALPSRVLQPAMQEFERGALRPPRGPDGGTAVRSAPGHGLAARGPGARTPGHAEPGDGASAPAPTGRGPLPGGAAAAPRPADRQVAPAEPSGAAPAAAPAAQGVAPADAPMVPRPAGRQAAPAGPGGAAPAPAPAGRGPAPGGAAAAAPAPLSTLDTDDARLPELLSPPREAGQWVDDPDIDWDAAPPIAARHLSREVRGMLPRDCSVRQQLLNAPRVAALVLRAEDLLAYYRAGQHVIMFVGEPAVAISSLSRKDAVRYLTLRGETVRRSQLKTLLSMIEGRFSGLDRRAAELSAELVSCVRAYCEANGLQYDGTPSVLWQRQAAPSRTAMSPISDGDDEDEY